MFYVEQSHEDASLALGVGVAGLSCVGCSTWMHTSAPCVHTDDVKAEDV